MKKDVLESQHDDFAYYVKIFVEKDNWFAVDKIQKFIGGHGNTFLDDKDGKMLFGVLKFFLDVALIQNRDIKTDDVYNLLNKFQDKLSWEQSCDLLIGFLDKDWDKGPNNKNLENANKLIDDFLLYLSKLKAKKVYTSEFNYVQEYFKKIMDDVPEIKTPKYLSYISDKLSGTDFPPQFCFEIVWLFGDELLKTDIKNLGWYAQFARFRLEITKIVREKSKDISVKKVESCFVDDIVGCFEFLRNYHCNTEHEMGKQISSKLIEYMNNKDVDWKTKLIIMNYLIFKDYYKHINNKNWRKYIPYDDLLSWKSVIRKEFQSPNDLLDVYAEVFPDLKCQDKFFLTWRSGGSNLFCVLCLVYSKKEIY